MHVPGGYATSVNKGDNKVIAIFGLVIVEEKTIAEEYMYGDSGLSSSLHHLMKLSSTSALALLSHVAASTAALVDSSSAAVVCVAGQCVQGFTNLSIGSLLSAPGSPASLLLLPGSYSASTNPQLLHAVLTSSSASLQSSPGFPNVSSSSGIGLPLNVQLQPGIAAYTSANYTGPSSFLALPDSNSSTSIAASQLQAQSLILPPNTYALLSSSSTSRLTIYDSLPDLSQLPSSSSLSGLFDLLSLQSTSCTTPCAHTGGTCTSAATCACNPGFTGPSCDACLPSHFGPACSPCAADCAQCDDGIAGSGVCLKKNVTGAPASCSCINGVCDSSGGCTCNAGYVDASNGTKCAACADGFFDPGDGSCKACALGCTSCAAQSGSCITCQSGFSINPSSPTQCLPPSSATTTTGGTQCPDGAFSNGTACVACNPLCATCTGASSAECVVCGAGRVRFGAECVQTDASGVCSTGNNNSTSGGAFVADNTAKVCTPCPAGCTACGIPNFSVASTVDQTQCSACLPGLVLDAGKCVDACPSGKVVGADGFTCQACDSTCSTCAGTTTHCLTCANGLLASNGTCVSSCPSTSFSSSGACTACHPDCATCTGPSFSQCASCPPARPVHTADGRCLEACARGTYLDATTGSCQPCDGACATCSGPGASACLSCDPAEGKVLKAGACVDAKCSANTTVVAGLGACLSDLVSIPVAASGTASLTAPLPTITGLDQPTTLSPSSSGSGGAKLAWWQILLMALGAVFLVLLALGCWRRRMRKRRAMETRAFAKSKGLDDVKGWRARLVRWGERVFGHTLGRRALGEKTRNEGKIRLKDAERERDLDLDLEGGRGRERERDVDTILDAYAYRDSRYSESSYYPHSHHMATSPVARRFAPQQQPVKVSAGGRDLNRLSGASLYTEITGQARRTADVRQPVRERAVLLPDVRDRDGGKYSVRRKEAGETSLDVGARDLEPRIGQGALLKSRFSGSTYSFGSSVRSEKERAPTPAEEYALSVLDMRAKEKERAPTPVLVNVSTFPEPEPHFGVLGRVRPATANATPVLMTTASNAPLFGGSTFTNATMGTGTGMGYGVDALANPPPPRGEYWLIRPAHTGASGESDASKKSKNPFLR